MAIKLVVADEDSLYRIGFRLTVEQDDDITVVGEVATGEEELRTILGSGIDVDVLVMSVPEPSSHTSVIREITSHGRGPRVLVLSSADDDEAVVGAVRAGAGGYLNRGVAHDELLRAVHAVATGWAVFSPAVASRMNSFFASPRGERKELASLSERERQILQLIAKGCDNRHIARQLVLAEKTVRNHITRLFRKLGVNDRMSAAMRAWEADSI